MSSSEEIEVEVVEIVDQVPASHSGRPASQAEEPARHERRSPFGGRIPIRSLRIPAFLWPLAIVAGLILLMLAALAAVVFIIPFLIIRAILRMLMGPSRQH